MRLDEQYPGYSGVLFLCHHLTKNVIVQWTGPGINQRAKFKLEQMLLKFFKGLGPKVKPKSCSGKRNVTHHHNNAGLKNTQTVELQVNQDPTLLLDVVIDGPPVRSPHDQSIAALEENSHSDIQKNDISIHTETSYLLVDSTFQPIVQDHTYASVDAKPVDKQLVIQADGVERSVASVDVLNSPAGRNLLIETLPVAKANKLALPLAKYTPQEVIPVFLESIDVTDNPRNKHSLMQQLPIHELKLSALQSWTTKSPGSKVCKRAPKDSTKVAKRSSTNQTTPKKCAADKKSASDRKSAADKKKLTADKESAADKKESAADKKGSAKTIDVIDKPKTKHVLAENLPVDQKSKGVISRCKYCWQQFSKKSHLKNHLARVHGKKRQCQVCDKIFYSLTEIRAHRALHEKEKSYKCIHCESVFESLNELKVHRALHGEERIYKCNVCEKRFRNNYGIREHMRTHAGEKPYLCAICGDRFCQSATLKYHMAIHSEDRPFKCSLCERAFKRKTGLQVHMQSHSNNKLYHCNLCNATLAYKSSLERHMLAHQGVKPHQCEYCGKRFISKSRISRHLRIHTGDKPFKCQICSKAFNQRHNLKTHMKTHRREIDLHV